MDSEQKQTPKSKAEVRDVMVALIGALIVALLVAANVQLGQMGNDEGTIGQPTAATEPVLPPPVQGTSNDVLAQKLRRLSQDLASPLNSLRGQLSPLSGLSAGQISVAHSFQNVADSVRDLGSAQQELAAMSSGLGQVVGSTESMADDFGGTQTTLSSLDHNIKTTGKSTNESMARVSSGIEAMRESISTMNGYLATTSSETKEMRASLTELNANMEELLSLFCVLLTSEACDSAETSSVTSTHVPEKVTEQGLGQPSP